MLFVHPRIKRSTNVRLKVLRNRPRSKSPISAQLRTLFEISKKRRKKKQRIVRKKHLKKFRKKLSITYYRRFVSKIVRKHNKRYGGTNLTGVRYFRKRKNVYKRLLLNKGLFKVHEKSVWLLKYSRFYLLEFQSPKEFIRERKLPFWFFLQLFKFRSFSLENVSVKFRFNSKKSRKHFSDFFVKKILGNVENNFRANIMFITQLQLDSRFWSDNFHQKIPPFLYHVLANKR